METGADDALRKFKKIVSQEWGALSESDTRSKIIDPIFKECLNWQEADIVREEGITEGFIDYIFLVNGQKKFLIEAKKEGKSFDLPEDIIRRSYSIDGIISKSKVLKECIEQSSRYCYEKGIRFAIITNGSQIIIYEAIKIGGEWRKGKCLIFKSHKDIEDNFVLFWNLFNKSSVSDGSFNKFLIEKSEIINFQRPLESIHNKEETLIRNNLNIYMRPFIEYLFEEITQDEKENLLKECYVYDKAFVALDEGMKTYFVDKMPYFSEAQGIKYFKEEKSSAGEFTLSFRKCEDFLRQSSPRGSVIVLLGGIGSGKTTFLHRFFKVILSNRKMLLKFYIDFRDSPIEENKLEEYIYQQMVGTLKDKYAKEKKTWFEDQGISEPSDANLKSYFTCVTAYLRSVGYNISLVIDNVDQHTPELQQKIFQVTKNICASQKIIAILSLREESFVSATQKGVQDAYYTHAFHIPSPVFRKLILVRLNYIINMLSKKSIVEIKSEIGTQIELTEEKIKEILNFFNIIRDSIDEGGQGSSINNFLTSISAGNMRKALKMFNNFLTSGNTNIKEILSIYDTNGFYKIPYHAFIKSVILGDSRYYLSDKNPYTFNLFDINTNFSSSHFLHLRILNYAFNNFSNISPVGKGFIEISKLKEEAKDFFITPESIDDSLLKLAKYDLIQFENQSQKDLTKASYFAITSTGSYYLTQLLSRFVYLDLIWMDTPISDKEVLSKLKHRMHLFNEETNLEKIEKRFQRVDIFLDYLRQAEQQEFILHPEYKDSRLMEREFVSEILSKFGDQKEYILRKLTEKEEIKSNTTIGDEEKVNESKSNVSLAPNEEISSF